MREIDVYALTKVITNIVENQHKLNTLLCGPDYLKTLHTDKGRPIKFNLAVFDETVEVLNCTPWKHWKSINDKTDLVNLKLEIADVWFFIASVIILCDHHLKQVMGDVGTVGLIIVNMISRRTDIETVMKKYKPEYKIQGMLEDSLLSIASIAGEINKISLFNPMLEDTFEHASVDEKKKAIVGVLDKISEMINIIEDVNYIALDSNIEDVMQTYVFKAVLNEFRDKNGYADGTYSKMWSYENETLEDNYVAKKIFDEDVTINIKDFYKKLDTAYQSFQ